VSEVFGFSRWFAGWVSVVAIGLLHEFSDQHGDRDLPGWDRRDCLPVGDRAGRRCIALDVGNFWCRDGKKFSPVGQILGNDRVVFPQGFGTALA
jgi:hypothetical protein